ELSVHNLPGRGVTFRAMLPVEGDRAELPAVRKVLPRHGAGVGRPATHGTTRSAAQSGAHGGLARRGRVLVIDDEIALAHAIRRALATDYDVELAGGSSEAFRRLAQVPDFDAILCDVVMPSADGIDFFHELSEKRPDLVPRLIFMTGASSLPRVSE